MIKIKNYNDFKTVLKQVDKNRSTAYQALLTTNYHPIKHIQKIQYFNNKKYNLLVATLEFTDDNSFEYFGIRTYDLLEYVKNDNPNFVNDEYIEELLQVKNKITKTDLDNYIVLGYLNNSNSFQIIFRHDGEKLPEDISNTIILLPSFSEETIRTFIDTLKENGISQDFKNQINTQLLVPLIEFNSAYNKLLNLSYIIPKDGKIKFDEPMSLIEILRKYHTESKTLGILGKMIKQSDEEDVLYSNVNCLEGQHNLKIENFDKIYFETWDIQNDIKIISDMVEEAYLLKRKSNSNKLIRNKKKSNNNKKSNKKNK